MRRAIILTMAFVASISAATVKLPTGSFTITGHYGDFSAGVFKPMTGQKTVHYVDVAGKVCADVSDFNGAKTTQFYDIANNKMIESVVGGACTTVPFTFSEQLGDLMGKVAAKDLAKTETVDTKKYNVFTSTMPIPLSYNAPVNLYVDDAGALKYLQVQGDAAHMW